MVLLDQNATLNQTVSCKLSSNLTSKIEGGQWRVLSKFTPAKPDVKSKFMGLILEEEN